MHFANIQAARQAKRRTFVVLNVPSSTYQGMCVYIQLCSFPMFPCSHDVTMFPSSKQYAKYYSVCCRANAAPLTLLRGAPRLTRPLLQADLHGVFAGN